MSAQTIPGDSGRYDEIMRSDALLRYSRLPPKYTQEFSTGARIKSAATFAFIALAITAFVLVCTGHLETLPHNFVQAFTHVNPTHVYIGVGITSVLVGGTAFVVYRAKQKEDPYVEAPLFETQNYNAYIEEAVFEYEQKGKSLYSMGYIDKSTLNAEQSGKAYIYAPKDTSGHTIVSTVVPLVTPIYVAATVVYHTIRLCIVPFYVLTCWAIEQCKGEPLFEGQRRFRLVDVVLEPAKSLAHIVKAPFYGLAYMAAGIYSHVNPMGGRILAAKIERDWNNGAARSEGYWSIEGPQGLWAGWGELGPEKLGQFKFFLAGCWQPIGVVEYQNGEIVRAASLSKAVNPARGKDYVVFPRSDLEKEALPLLREARDIRVGRQAAAPQDLGEPSRR